MPRGNRLPCIPLSHMNFAYCILRSSCVLCSFFSVSLGFSPCMNVCVCSQITALSWQNTKQCRDDKMMTMITFHDTLLQLYHTDETKWKCKFNDCLSIFVQLQTNLIWARALLRLAPETECTFSLLLWTSYTHTYISIYIYMCHVKC